MPDLLEPFDLTDALPFDRDANDAPQRAVLGVAPEHFLYLGQGLTAAQFAAYVASYSFGRIPPDQIVLHHTAIPSTLAARYPSGAVWDAGETNLTEQQIYAKRLRQLGQLRDYYHQILLWDRGPHLFIDERYIWLFTPMNAVGIHAKEGNSYVDANGRLHYSIGIEVLGYYEHVVWPDKVVANVAAACQALGRRLGIALEYRAGPRHTPSAHATSVSSHRDYNKIECPGRAISETYYTRVLNAAPALPPADPFQKWGNVGKPTGAATGFAVPRAWLVNQVLGKCMVPETYAASGKYSVTEFENGIITFFKQRNTTVVERF